MVVVRHPPLVLVLAPLGFLFLFALFVVTSLRVVSAFIPRDSTNPNPVSPVAIAVCCAFLAPWAARMLWLCGRTFYGYCETCTIDDTGITVQDAQGVSQRFPWSDVSNVDRPTPFMIRIFTRKRRPIIILNNGFGSDFVAADKLIRAAIG
jgi:hypothetical protein